jgi:hypothetical protein
MDFDIMEVILVIPSIRWSFLVHFLATIPVLFSRVWVFLSFGRFSSFIYNERFYFACVKKRHKIPGKNVPWT